MVILAKEEFVHKFMEDQAKRQEAKTKKKVKTAMPFKEEIYNDVNRVVKTKFKEAVTTKDKELVVTTDIGKFSIKVVEKRVRVPLEDQEIKKEAFKSDVYESLLKYYKDTEKREVFFSKEGVVIRRGEADYTIKITKKKK